MDPVPDPLVLGSSGALRCSTQLEVNSIQWLDSPKNILAETTTGEKSLTLSIGYINDTLYDTVYTCIVDITTCIISQEVFTIDVTGKSDSIYIYIMFVLSISVALNMKVL